MNKFRRFEESGTHLGAEFLSTEIALEPPVFVIVPDVLIERVRRRVKSRATLSRTREFARVAVGVRTAHVTGHVPSGNHLVTQ